ncbi:MAG: hypothetical protein RMJ33_09750 [Saprospiraceae bacterium]|nr:hypothetical protein [Saprospiraceae bacterium]
MKSEKWKVKNEKWRGKNGKWKVENEKSELLQLIGILPAQRFRKIGGMAESGLDTSSLACFGRAEGRAFAVCRRWMFCTAAVARLSSLNFFVEQTLQVVVLPACESFF